MSAHPETALIPYVRGELGPAERERVAAHVAGCGECAEAAESFRALLAGLAAAPPAAPEIHWGRYRAELSHKLDRARGPAAGVRGPAASWWWRPVPIAVSAMLAGVLVYLAAGGVRPPRAVDLAGVEEAVLGERLEILRRYALLQDLDLLEDLDVIRELDALAPPQKG